MLFIDQEDFVENLKNWEYVNTLLLTVYIQPTSIKLLFLHCHGSLAKKKHSHLKFYSKQQPHIERVTFLLIFWVCTHCFQSTENISRHSKRHKNICTAVYFQSFIPSPCKSKSAIGLLYLAQVPFSPVVGHMIPPKRHVQCA